MYRMFSIEIILFFILTTDSQFVYPSSRQKQRQFTADEFHSCFSQLTGPVERLCPAVEDIHRFNIDVFHSLISDLVTRPYFRYYQVNICDREIQTIRDMI